MNWILDADIEGFFDAIDHEWLIKFLEHRIGDRRILRLIRPRYEKLGLCAGVSEEGQWSRATVGTPQGAVISPLLANVYLHYVFDLWIEWWRKNRCRGDVIVVRYADDFVIGFENHSEATACLEELRTRFAKFGLKLHEGKTRLIEFGRYAIERRSPFIATPWPSACGRQCKRSKRNCESECTGHLAKRPDGCEALCADG